MTFIANINVQNIRAKKNYIVTNDETHCDFKYTWLAGTCLIVGDSILTGIDKNWLSKNNQAVQVWDFRGATIDDLIYPLVPCPLYLKETGTHNFA